MVKTKSNVKLFENSSKTDIIVKTKFNKLTDKDGNITNSSIEETFHEVIYDKITEFLTENDDFKQEVFDDMRERIGLSKKYSEFTDFGSICITINQKKIDLKIPELIESFECEYCHKQHENETSANNCESKHKKTKDIHYEEYLIQEEKKKLELASRHPSQKKLIGEKQ